MAYSVAVHDDTRMSRMFYGQLVGFRHLTRSGAFNFAIATLSDLRREPRAQADATFLAQSRGGRHDDLAGELRHSIRRSAWTN